MQGCHFSGNLWKPGNIRERSVKSRGKAKSRGRSGNLCGQGNLIVAAQRIFFGLESGKPVNVVVWFQPVSE